jgi:hypothetical protein
VHPHDRTVSVYRVGDSDGASFNHSVFCFIDGEPGDLAGFTGWVAMAADQAAPESERYDSADHVLVDAGQPLSLDLDARFFEDFAGDPVGWCFVQLQDAARGTQRPSSVRWIARIRPSSRITMPVTLTE